MLLLYHASSFVSDKNPLHIAIKNKNFKIMRLLYNVGDANPGRNLDNELPPLILSIQQNDTLLMKELLHWKETVVDFEQRDDKGRNILHLIAVN